MNYQPFEFFSTTADMGFDVRADDLAQLFSNSALALINIITNPQQINSHQAIPIQIQADNWEDLVVNWLSEILYQQEVKGFLFANARVYEVKPYFLSASLEGEAYDPMRHSILHQVKAITYHKLSLSQDEQGIWHLHVIVDV